MYDYEQVLRIRHNHQLILLRPYAQELSLIVVTVQLLDHAVGRLYERPHHLRNLVCFTRAYPSSLTVGAIGVGAVGGGSITFGSEILSSSQARRADYSAIIAREDESALDSWSLRESAEQTLQLFRGGWLLHRVRS